jgi:hypothetical protein
MNLALFTGLILTTNFFTMLAVEEPKMVIEEPQKKEQRMKVVVNQNGKEIKIDTTFNFADQKSVQAKVDSILKQNGIEQVCEEGNHIIIMKDGKHMTMTQSGNRMPGSEEMQVFYQEGDSGKVKGKKIVRIHKKGDIAIFDADGEMIPPPPPMPPLHVRATMNHSDPFAINPNDEDIVTYDKKDIGKGLEKITIVRKKRNPERSIVVEGFSIDGSEGKDFKVVEGKEIKVVKGKKIEVIEDVKK